MPKILDNPRESIMEHAKKIILTEGYTSFTIRKVSDATGIGIGTIYNYFPTKKDLTMELMLDYWEDYLVYIKKLNTEEKDFYKKLHKIYEELVNFTRKFLEVWIKDSAKEYTPEDQKKRKDFTERFILVLEDILKEASEEGQINIPTNFHDTANFLVLNIIMLAQMNLFEYDNFERIIRKLFS